MAKKSDPPDSPDDPTRWQGSANLLAFRSGNEDWLVDLADTGEIVTLPVLVPVPLTRPFFAGIANIRGQIYGVSDFSLFRGGVPTLRTADARLLLVATRHGNNAALLVDRLLGLRKAGDFVSREADPAAPPWAGRSCLDDGSQVWNRLEVRHLLADEQFMNIG